MVQTGGKLTCRNSKTARNDSDELGLDPVVNPVVVPHTMGLNPVVVPHTTIKTQLVTVVAGRLRVATR